MPRPSTCVRRPPGAGHKPPTASGPAPDLRPTTGRGRAQAASDRHAAPHDRDHRPSRRAERDVRPAARPIRRKSRSARGRHHKPTPKQGQLRQTVGLFGRPPQLTPIHHDIVALPRLFTPDSLRTHPTRSAHGSWAAYDRPQTVVGRGERGMPEVVGGLCPAPDGRRTLRRQKRVAMWRTPTPPTRISHGPASGLCSPGPPSRPVMSPSLKAWTGSFFWGLLGSLSFLRGGTVGQEWPKAIAKRRDDEGGAPLRDRPDPEGRWD
ncbi:hypothetical protein ACVWXB_005593 [Streptomyces sp. TE12347]